MAIYDLSIPQLNSLNGVELAEFLALALTDLEFEMLIRKRIILQFDVTHASDENLADHQNTCYYTHSWGDEGKWTVRVGETYSKNGESSGQVLSQTLNDAYAAYTAKNRNKLSLLLAAPTAMTAE